MKKRNFLIAAMCMLMFPCTLANLNAKPEIIPLQVSVIDPTINQGGPGRSPVVVPELSIDNHTLYLYEVGYDCTLQLVDTNGNVVYTTTVSANTPTVELPSTLSGTYTLQLIPGGSYYFEGEMEL